MDWHTKANFPRDNQSNRLYTMIKLCDDIYWEVSFIKKNTV
jgi:hypothetical protein